MLMLCTLFITYKQATVRKVGSTYLGRLFKNAQRICLWQGSNA